MELKPSTPNPPDAGEIESLVHDLRNALARVRASSDVLTECRGTLSDAEVVDFLAAIQSGTENASNLVVELRARVLCLGRSESASDLDLGSGIRD